MKRGSAVKRTLYDALLAALLLTAAGSAAAIAAKTAESRGQSAQMESLEAVVRGAGGSAGDRRTAAGGVPGRGGESGGDKIGGNQAGAGNPQDLPAGLAYPARRDPAVGGEELIQDADPGQEARRREEQRARRQEGYALLHEQNPDMAGWICIEGSRVNYPVMQSPDRPDFYLSHGFDQKKSRYGVPYAAKGCDLSDGTCPNIVIYGHHMKDGSMFAGLMRYTDQAYGQAHPVIQFDTLEACGDYQIIAVVKETALSEGAELFGAARAEDEEQFMSYVRAVKKKSLYEMGRTAVWGDHLLTLVTCEYSKKEGRLLVVAKKTGPDL